jgi:predicted metal-dependent enzyme (double-stranded beta helix superfamily)
MLALDSVRLDSITREYAARSALWASDLHFRADERWSVRLHADADVDVWLITWLQEQSTSLHDHGDSAGAFTVVRGTLREYLPSSREYEVAAGSTRSFSPGYVHDVYNPYPEPAVSVHAYSPPLSRMSYYELGSAGELELVMTTSTIIE